MKRVGIIIGIVLILGAYVFGYWPERQATLETRQHLAIVQTQLTAAQSQLALCRLQIHLLALVRQTEAKNYGNASSLSTSFFNEVSRQASAATDSDVKSTLQSILQKRDAVTGLLAKGDPSALGMLQPLEDSMFNLVNKSLGAAPAS